VLLLCCVVSALAAVWLRRRARAQRAAARFSVQGDLSEAAEGLLFSAT